MLARSTRPSPHEARAGSRLSALVGRIWAAATARRDERTLRICEMLSLGDRRFLAVIECDRQRFLLAGTPQNISLLERLEDHAGRKNRASDEDLAEGSGL